MKITRIIAGLPILAVSAVAWADGPQTLDQAQLDSVTAGSVGFLQPGLGRENLGSDPLSTIADLRERQADFLAAVAQILVANLSQEKLAEVIDVRDGTPPDRNGGELPPAHTEPVIGGDGKVAEALQNPRLVIAIRPFRQLN
ncbi:MAG: hypothetical protein EA405_03865 [Rhodospirillales bacterium]|nr:MAG: hypothetical protein EA405_03865 [Rhodospirillales bacterium]